MREWTPAEIAAQAKAYAIVDAMDEYERRKLRSAGPNALREAREALITEIKQAILNE